MKFFHLSDLHIGKQLNGWSLRENQEAVLGQIVRYAEEYRPDAVLICGDIYDKSVPPGGIFHIWRISGTPGRDRDSGACDCRKS